MAASISRPAPRAGGLPRLWWLPRGGHGNGLDDTAWAPFLDVPPDVAAEVLAAFAAAGVPAYAAPAPAGWYRRTSRRAGLPVSRVWVGTSAYGRAEDALMTVLPPLLPRARSS